MGTGYLLGSIDFGVIASRLAGVDIYSSGSGNPGASNVLRAMGRRAAAGVLLGDLAKGVAAAAVGGFAGGELVGYAAGFAAVVGHCFPVWHRFRGGKGVSTAGGMFLWLEPVMARRVPRRLGGPGGPHPEGLDRLAGHGGPPAAGLGGRRCRGWPLAWAGATAALIVARHARQHPPVADRRRAFHRRRGPLRVEVAVVPAAGRGTRMHPATRSVPKAMLPVVDRPAIQWIVEEGIAAGVGEFVVVVSPGVEDLLYSHFEGMEGLAALSEFDGVGLTWVVQEEARGLGHAVLQAGPAVGSRPFFCLLGDMLAPPGSDLLRGLAAASDGRSVVALREIDADGLSRYGVVAPTGPVEAGVVEVGGAVEKPGPRARPIAPGHRRALSLYPGDLPLARRPRAGPGWGDPIDRCHRRPRPGGPLPGPGGGPRPPGRGQSRGVPAGDHRFGPVAPRRQGTVPGVPRSPDRGAMEPLAEAQREILAAMTPLREAEVPLSEALGLCLTEDVVAPHPIPPFANSSLDGFAVRAADTAGAPCELEVLEDVPAGRMPTLAVRPGAAVRIMTGAPLPAGADAVVRVERTSAAGSGRVRVEASVPAGDGVRAVGQRPARRCRGLSCRGTAHPRALGGCWRPSAWPGPGCGAGPWWRCCRPATR